MLSDQRNCVGAAAAPDIPILEIDEIVVDFAIGVEYYALVVPEGINDDEGLAQAKTGELHVPKCRLSTLAIVHHAIRAERSRQLVVEIRHALVGNYADVAMIVFAATQELDLLALPSSEVVKHQLERPEWMPDQHSE